jgi:hypothetical protein
MAALAGLLTLLFCVQSQRSAALCTIVGNADAPLATKADASSECIVVCVLLRLCLRGTWSCPDCDVAAIGRSCRRLCCVCCYRLP